jgi:hypothetical protein
MRMGGGIHPSANYSKPNPPLCSVGPVCGTSHYCYAPDPTFQSPEGSHTLSPPQCEVIHRCAKFRRARVGEMKAPAAFLGRVWPQDSVTVAFPQSHGAR